ncbi:MAG: ABC transporter permease [Bacteroidales bacterium]|nr:ABC transporter permease [Bacteroidales bacterium]
MRRFLGFVRKEFIHIFRDIRTLSILFGLPGVMIILFGYVVSTDLKNASLAFLDLSKDDVSVELTDKICSSGFFRKTADLSGFQDIDRILRSGKAKAVIIFGEDFGRDLEAGRTARVSIIADGSEPNMATLVANYATAIISGFNQQLTMESQVSVPVIVPEVRMFYNPSLKSQFMFVPGVITMIMILICALMTSITLTREKEFGTMEVLLVSPLKPVQIILGKVTPYFFLSFVNVVTILVLSRLVFGMPVNGSPILLLAESMLYILLSLSIGILISAVSKTMQQAIFISLVGMMLPTVLLSGFIFPIENMPKVYNWISAILPPRYFIVIIKNIMIKGAGFAHVWKETLILSFMTVILIVLAIKNFKIRLQ